MALLAQSRPGARARWTLAALLGRLPFSGFPGPVKSAPRPVDAMSPAADRAAARGRLRRTRRHYPRQHESLFEHSAMAREMFRL